nr:PREDICTED: tyrosine-protein phosphatase non-receptor type 4 [Bemisia tabaci]
MIESVSRRAFGSSRGTYNVRASELAHDNRKRLKTISCSVVFLDDTQHTFQVEKRAKGNVLLNAVYQHLELIEKDYFGLQYCENGAIPSVSNPDNVRWLDPTKPVKKQLRGGSFYFRVKFYVSDPSKLQEEYTRYHLYLQVRKDIMQGRLVVPPNTACLLASYTVQSELGDYHPDEHAPGYLSEMALIPNQTEDMEHKICELHKLHKGQTPADAEFNFLDHAKRLDMYGLDLHKAKDQSGKELQLGVTSTGLVVFQNSVKINTFSWCKIVKISFKQKQFFVQLKREPSENYDTLLGFNLESYRSAKQLWRSCVEHHTFFRLHSPQPRSKNRFLPPPFPLVGSRFSYSGRTEYQTIEEGKSRGLERSFIRSRSKSSTSRLRQSMSAVVEEKPKQLILSRTPRPYDNKVTSLGAREPRRAWGDTPSPLPQGSDDEGGFLERTLTEERQTAFSPHLPNRTALTFVDDDTVDLITDRMYMDSSEPNYCDTHEDNFVVIRILPDEQGRFGFNVKGGSDLNMPILVSRVAPNTPADKCYPKLNEGDQVIMINEIDISNMSHEQVVNLIRASRDTSIGELVLTVKPNSVYEAGGHDVVEEPPYQYVPDPSLGIVSINGHNALEQSMLLLADGLASGALVTQFERLYRRKSGLTMNVARKNENVNKNRYRDILPYDATRVILSEFEEDDYINGNYINMEIPGSGIINRYIATQGPLSNTIGDFWRMVSKVGSGLVVMLTPLTERGRVKCHRYWPPLGESLSLPPTSLVVTTTKEQSTDDGSCVFREFKLKDLQTEEERDISHMQYLSWPDHGVPGDVVRFLSFTAEVRALRAGMVEPAIVHCSAGIGRTGVLILMETAMCLVEANQPVYPLDIVRQMRDQRAMMVQTPNQYRFVCGCVHHAYVEGIVKPLPEFCQ